MDTGTTASTALTLQFLAWVADGPRSYGEAMDACGAPARACRSGRTRSATVWLENGGTMKSSRVLLTAAGKAMLAGKRP